MRQACVVAVCVLAAGCARSGASAGGARGDGGDLAGAANGAAADRDGATSDGASPADLSSLASFFVTSRGLGSGGDLRASPSDADGLAGGDALCATLAASSPVLAGRSWRAYLSTSGTDARDRIGAGPWHNVRGVLIAHTVAELHEEGGARNAIEQATALDEQGHELVGFDHPAGTENVHDILTGATPDGRTAASCADWTSADPDTRGRVGHSDRMGGTTNSWNSVHDTDGCAESGDRSVRSAGGRGSLYCFAL